MRLVSPSQYLNKFVLLDFDAARIRYVKVVFNAVYYFCSLKVSKPLHVTVKLYAGRIAFNATFVVRAQRQSTKRHQPTEGDVCLSPGKTPVKADNGLAQRQTLAFMDTDCIRQLQGNLTSSRRFRAAAVYLFKFKHF